MRERGIVRYQFFYLVSASSTPVSPILRPDDGQIMVFDDDDDV